MMLEHRTGPHTGRHCIAAIDTDLAAFQLAWMFDAEMPIHQDPAMVERANDENGKRRQRLAICAGAQIGRHGHLGDIELSTANHPPKRLDDRRHFLEFERPGTSVDLACFQGLSVPKGLDASLQSCHSNCLRSTAVSTSHPNNRRGRSASVLAI